VSGRYEMAGLPLGENKVTSDWLQEIRVVYAKGGFTL